MKKIEFVKMHGLGNDFVIIDSRDAKGIDFSKKAKSINNRKTGIGADQLLILERAKKAAAFMRVYNSDGSEAEMCGNGLRCVAAFLKKNGDIKKKETLIDTAAGVRHVIIHSDNDIEVDMGRPEFNPKKIPIDAQREDAEYNIIIDGLKYTVSCVGIGNPHCVIIGNDAQLKRIGIIGPDIEKDAFFPKRTNVEIVKVEDRKNIKVRIWERGTGETEACGSGATAAMVVCRKLGLVSDYVKVNMPGGNLKIKWDLKGNAYKRGPAAFVYSGTFDLNGF